MMIEILAQATAEGVGLGAAGAAALGVVTLLIKRGVTGTFSIGNGKNGNGNGKPPQICPLHHEFAQRLDERHQTIQHSLAAIVAGQDKIEQGITRLHERIDAMR